MKKLIFILFFISGTLLSQVRFDANFESGNINTVSTADSISYKVTTRGDIGGRWFYFRISGVKNRLIKVTISSTDVNRPLYSYDNKEFYRFSLLESPKMNYFEKKFEEDTVYVAYYRPYNYSYLQKKIKEWNSNKDVKLDTLGFTTHNLPIQMMTVTDKSVDDKNKKRIWLHARTHPSETPSSWQLEGLVNQLLKNEPVMNYYRQNMIFYIVPFTNPDGVYYGRSRTNFDGVDVEANWDNTVTCKEVQILKKKMTELNNEKKFSVFLNMHSQASPFCTFWVHTAESTTPVFYRQQMQFCNINTSYNPYFQKNDYSFSSLKTVFPEGFLYKNYGTDIIALTYETPYDRYSTNIWVDNFNLYELGVRTLYSIAEYLNLSHPEHYIVDNKDAVIIGGSTKGNSGIEFFGDDYIVLDNAAQTAKAVYTIPALKAGIYDIDGWWPSGANYASNVKINIEANGNKAEVEKTQNVNGAQWNFLTQFTLPADGQIKITVEGNQYKPVVADAFRINFKSPTSHVEKEAKPEDFTLYQNYPNPFNPSTTIRFTLKKDAYVRINVFDALGRDVMSLMDEFRNKGTYEIPFNAVNLASGVYFYRILADRYQETKKMLLIK